MSKLSKLLVLLSVVFISTTLFAQKNYKLTGTVRSADNGEVLIGANVFLKGTTIGAATDANGKYVIEAPAGKYTVVCSYVGFGKKAVDINLTNNMQLNFALKEYQFQLNVTVIADRAKERETPVAFTNVDKKDMEFKLGSRDIPLVLNTTPSVYATQQGGGAGDARVNVRGFNQKNVAIMINGVPVNDMENGWVYWSNWDGLGDASNSIQVQRGLTAVNLATPSIGGTMNIITDPSAQKAGFKFRQEIGSGNFNKKTLFVNTGLVNNKFALSFGGVRKTGQGFIDRTWTDAWAYYLGASYNINDKNRIELYAIGAPQRHGQNLYRQNAAAYDHAFAKDVLGYSQEALDHYPEKGRLYNENWNSVSSSYTGKQFWDGTTHLRHSPNFINERENYYHKPLVNLNWYSQFNKKTSLYTTLYYSGGVGGGSGTYGHLAWDYSGPSRVADWDATIAANIANVDTNVNASVSKGILRNSVNTQWTIGAISKLYYKVNQYLNTSFGIDWRTAEINHFREVRDLLGGKYYYYSGNEFDSPADYYKKLGDKIAYNFTNTVDWIGGYAQAEYNRNRYTLFGMAGYSMVKYGYTNHFKKDAQGNELKATPDANTGFQIKGGASYRMTTTLDIYANAGYVAQVPIFDQVIDDRNATVETNPKNQKFTSVETGANWTGLDGKLSLKGNFYFTLWQNRTKSIQKYDRSLNTDYLIFVKNLTQLHTGLELSGAFQPIRQFRLDGAFSYGYWKTTSNADADFKYYNNASANHTETLYVKDLYIGDAPQTQLALAATIFPIKGLSTQVVFKYYDRFYADWNPETRTDKNDTKQSWLTPSYTLWDLHFNYTLPMQVDGLDIQVFAHVFNLFDAMYVQDAVDNSKYNAYTKNGKDHSADDAEVFLGLPRTFNLGIQVAY
jgi:iron complex outermembrane receptor protein